MCSVIRLLTHSVVGTNVTTYFWHRFLRLRGFFIGSLSFSSLYSYLQKFLSPFFLIAHHMFVSITCSIRWFGNYSWKSSPRGLLSSVLKHQQSSDCCSSHTRFAAWRSGGFLPQMLIRRASPAITPNGCWTKPVVVSLPKYSKFQT